MKVFSVVLVALISCHVCVQSGAGESPRLLFLDGELLALGKERVALGDPRYAGAISRVIRDANFALTRGPFSVAFDTENPPPSGDFHDFLAYGSDCWPNENTPDGTPWVCTDGAGNPNAQLDHNQLYEMQKYVPLLARAYYLTDNEQYAEHASSLIRTFFLDAATRMNPHATYSKIIPGVAETGFATALIGGRLIDIADSISLLQPSVHWLEEDDMGFRQWAADYSIWLDEHPDADFEFNTRNNHGTITELQMATFAYVSGDLDRAAMILAESFNGRIAPQIAPDGFQPAESARTTSLDYHLLNLDWLTHFAMFGEEFGLDIWSMETEDGRGLRFALDTLIPYATQQVDWPFPESRDVPIYASRFYNLFRKAAAKYGDSRYGEAARALDLEYPIAGLRHYFPQWTDILWAVDDPVFGDVNGDGFVDNLDWYPLMLAIDDAEAFAEHFPGVPRSAADLDGNKSINGRDLDVFLRLPIPFGDSNRDGAVDVEDLNNVRNNFGSAGPRILGDTNGDNVVNAEDLNAVRNNFGLGKSAVPEPTAAALALAGLLAMLLGSRRSCGRSHSHPGACGRLERSSRRFRS